MTLRDHAANAALAALCLYLMVSGNLLTAMGSHYVLDGGIIVEKIHPASYLAMLAGLLRLAADAQGLAGARSLLHRNQKLFVFLFAIAFCSIYALLLNGPGGVVALLDTFLPAGMLALALADSDAAVLHRLRMLLQVLIVINACLAIAEAASTTHLIKPPAEETLSARDFRPYALYDHPLTGATATMLGWMLRPDCRDAPAAGFAYRVIILVALLAFAERVPLLLTCAAGLWGGTRSAAQRLVSRRLGIADMAAMLLWPVVIGMVAALAIAAGLGQRLESSSLWDASAGVRLSAFSILYLLSPSELLFGARRDDLIALIEPLRLANGAGVIENFWLVMLVTLGGLCFPIFVAGFVALLRWLWQRAGAPGRQMIWTLVIAASTSNSLGRKSMLLVLLAGCVAASQAIPIVRAVVAPRRPA